MVPVAKVGGWFATRAAEGLGSAKRGRQDRDARLTNSTVHYCRITPVSVRGGDDHQGTW